MALEIPSWLTKEFIKHALENTKDPLEDDVITVDDMEIVKPIPKGDNYVCDILRVSVTYRKCNISDKPLKTSLIIKAPIRTGMHDTVERMGLLQKEVRIYNEYLPKLNRLLDKKEAITANSFFCDQENVLVLEDLKPKGYVMADRRQQLDFEHSVLALKALAVFHAASVRLHEDEPKFVEEVGLELFFNEDIKEFNQYFASINFKLLAKQCEKVPELERYASLLFGYGENAWALMLEMIKPKENSLNVLNHGDFWVNNMLFKYENEKPVSVNLMDFQISRYTQPVFDLHYILYSSVQEEVRLKKKDELLNEYITELNSNLERFGCSQRLTNAELKKSMDECEFWAILVSSTLFPITIADPKDGVMDLGQLSDNQFKDLENNPMGHYYKNKVFLDIIKKRLDEFAEKGWF